jgi:hypothetical protein
MDKDKKFMADMLENYLLNCQEYGYSDFEVWCEENIQNDTQESLLHELVEHANAIAGLLYL